MRSARSTSCDSASIDSSPSTKIAPEQQQGEQWRRGDRSANRTTPAATARITIRTTRDAGSRPNERVPRRHTTDACGRCTSLTVTSPSRRGPTGPIARPGARAAVAGRRQRSPNRSTIRTTAGFSAPRRGAGDGAAPPCAGPARWRRSGAATRARPGVRAVRAAGGHRRHERHGDDDHGRNDRQASRRAAGRSPRERRCRRDWPERPGRRPRPCRSRSPTRRLPAMPRRRCRRVLAAHRGRWTACASTPDADEQRADDRPVDRAARRPRGAGADQFGGDELADDRADEPEAEHRRRASAARSG